MYRLIIFVSFIAQPVKCPVDIVFVLDESGSVGSDNFDLMKSFVSQLVGRFDIDSGNTRVGLVTYSSSVIAQFNLSDYNTTASVQSSISSLNYSGGSTDTAAALAYVRTWMLTSEAGDRSNVPNVVVVLTDGSSNDPPLTAVSVQQSMCLF